MAAGWEKFHIEKVVKYHLGVAIPMGVMFLRGMDSGGVW
jgi:hypothetical protein